MVKKCSDDLRKRVVDQNAETVAEIKEKHPYFSYGYISKMASDKVAAGKWEQVHKKTGKRFTYAYRPKKR